ERSRYMKNDMFSSFKTVIWSVEHGDEEAPPMSAFFQQPGEANANDDDDVEMTSRGARSLKCPLTLARLVEPVKSQKCPHTFSRVAIMQMLNGRQKACPVAGCPQQLRPQDLVRDRVMER
ncbi:zinc-finger of the MIZ type in Nse subunit-domain-containing protein, partial [Protomyces lactucae-debilis]